MLRHLGLIPDGNRRWARAKGMRPTFGHYSSGSYENIMAIIKEAIKLKVKYFSVWGFSTENWKRSDVEKKAIFQLLVNNIDTFLKEAHKNKIRFRHIGRRDRLPKYLLEKLLFLEESTKEYDLFHVNLCLDYGGRDELLRAISSYCKQWGNSNHLTEEKFSAFLDTYGIPDVDLVIRTSGEKRTSGFLPWQTVYAELYFVDVHFPDFKPAHLRKAVTEFNNRNRRFGR